MRTCSDGAAQPPSHNAEDSISKNNDLTTGLEGFGRGRAAGNIAGASITMVNLSGKGTTALRWGFLVAESAPFYQNPADRLNAGAW